MDEPVLIRSYRQVFSLERRLYRVDRWAIPVPGGVPLAGLLYFGGVLAGVCVLGLLPLTGSLVEMVPPPVRFVLIPLTAAVLGTQTAPDGRRADRFARDWLSFRMRGLARRFATDSGLGGEIALRSDHHRPALARARVRGQARVSSSAGVRAEPSLFGGLALRPSGSHGEPVDISVPEGEVLEVRP